MADEIVRALYIGCLADVECAAPGDYERIVNVLNLIEPDENHFVDVEVLDALALIIRRGLQAGERVLVHCAGGTERSPLVVAWYMAKYQVVATLDDAYEIIQEKRPMVFKRDDWVPWHVRGNRGYL